MAERRAFKESAVKRDAGGEFSEKAGGPAAPKKRAAATPESKAAGAAKKAANAAESGKKWGSRTLIREQLTGDDAASKAKRKAAEAMHAQIAKRAKLEGVSTAGMTEAGFLALAKRAGQDPNSDAVIHATWLNSAGQGATKAMTNADKATAKAEKEAAKPKVPDKRVSTRKR